MRLGVSGVAVSKLACETESYIAGGYYLSRIGGTPDWTGTELRATSLATDHSLRRFFPNAWALSWCQHSPDERIAAAAVFGIEERDLPRVVAWADNAFNREFGVWHTFYTLAGAQAAARAWLQNVPDVELWGVGLRRELVSGYCELTTPPEPQPGYAPVGRSGVQKAICHLAAPLAEGGIVLGHELLSGELTGWLRGLLFDTQPAFEDASE